MLDPITYTVIKKKEQNDNTNQKQDRLDRIQGTAAGTCNVSRVVFHHAPRPVSVISQGYPTDSCHRRQPGGSLMPVVVNDLLARASPSQRDSVDGCSRYLQAMGTVMAPDIH